MERVTPREIIIPVSKRKILLLLFGSVLFVAGSFWLWSITDTEPLFSGLIVRVVAVAGVTFSGLCGVYACVKVFDRRPGLVIDSQGIVDNASGVSAGRVPWDEITGLIVFSFAGQRFLTIQVVDPQKYAGRGGFFKRMLNAANSRMSGSPINIPSTALCVSFDELARLVGEAFHRYKSADPGATS